jgi:AIPR protein
MSSLKVNQIKSKLCALFESHLDLTDISTVDRDRDNKVLSRCLAALAVYLQSGCTEEQASQSVWDGGGDNGIDAAYFDQANKTVLFVQSKWIGKGTGEPEAQEIAVFVKGVRDVLEGDPDAFHSRLGVRFADICSRLQNPGTLVETVVISTGASKLAKPGQSHIDGLLREWNENDTEPVAFAKTLGLSEVYSGLASGQRGGKLTLDATLQDWSLVAAPYPAYFGLIDGLQLKIWWLDHGPRLVSENIRHSLGATEVNTQIKDTAALTPERFWYYNNGITLVAEDADKAPARAASRSAGVFSFQGASIVNGAQTVSSLGRVEDDQQLGLVRVPIRVILLKSAPKGFGKDVTRTNNLQNRIEPRDFTAQDPEQARLRNEMAMENIDYQYLRREEVAYSPTACDLMEATTALACASGDSALAVQAKAGIGKFFLDLTKGPYKAIFNASTSGAKTFNAIVVQRQVEEWIGAKKKTAPKKSGPGWGVLVHGNRLITAAVFRKFDTLKLSQPIASFGKTFDQSDVGDLCEDVYGRMLSKIQDKYQGKILAGLFKNQELSKDVYDFAVEQ